MPISPRSDAPADPTDPVNMSLGTVVAWVAGALTLLGGIAGIIQNDAIASGAIFIVAGLFGLPPTRNVVESGLNVDIPRLLAVLVYLILVGVGVSLQIAGGA